MPRAAEATNLLNPVTLSATHMAYASLRMEPTFMILGEAAGVAAALAIDTQQPVQAVDYATLRQSTPPSLRLHEEYRTAPTMPNEPCSTESGYD